MFDRTRPRHPALAAALSFVFPGLGQAYAGRFRSAALLGAPVLILVAAASALAVLRGSELRNELLSSAFLWAVIVVDLALLAWRLLAIGHAWLTTNATFGAGAAVGAAVSGDGTTAASAAGSFPGFRAQLVSDRLRRSPLTIGAVAVFAAATLAMHGYIAVVAGTLNSTLETVFEDAHAGDETSTDGSDDDEPAGRPAAQSLNLPEYHWDGTDRVNFLLLGVDSGRGRTHALDDTILVVSVDPLEREAVMVSVPRDTGYMPLPDESIYPGGLYPAKINQLSSEARQSPELWCPDLPESVDCGLRTLERSVGLYLGIPIHYYARIDLQGFSQLIDELGGVELCLPGRLVDPQYAGPTWYDRPVGVTLEAGCDRLPGPEALAFARIRQGWMEMPSGEIEYQNDFLRTERQQELLLALRREMVAIDPVFELPGVLNAVASTVTTDFPRSMAGDLASLLPAITRSDVERVVLGYPQYVDPPIDEASNYVLIPRRDAIRERMEELFGADRPLEGWYVGSEAASPSDPEAQNAPDSSGAPPPTDEPPADSQPTSLPPGSAGRSPA